MTNTQALIPCRCVLLCALKLNVVGDNDDACGDYVIMVIMMIIMVAMIMMIIMMIM